METTATARLPEPETPGSGLIYRPVPVEGWRIAADGATCRHHASAMGIYACGEPAVAEKHYPNDPISTWWAFCDRHLRAQKLWAEDGTVLKWVLCHPDGTAATRQEIVRAQGKRIGVRERPSRGPAQTSPHPVRLRNDLWEGAEDAALAVRMTASAWIRQAMQARLGELRCERCPDDAPPVPVEFAHLTGKSLDAWLAEAGVRVKRQHPRHEPVLVGAEAPAPLAHPGVVPFRSPAVKP
jgi:hypothetical protein